ncbi:MAG: SdiA-regulated domain-containing protein [Patescibacteria group bacterium]
MKFLLTCTALLVAIFSIWWGMHLDPGVGSFTNQVSTTTRYGDRNLTHLSTIGEVNLSLLDDSSGIEYVPTTDTLYIVHNGRTGNNSEIDEVTKEGALLRQLICTTCGDIEGITLVSSVASTTAPGVFDNTFILSSENDTANARIYRVVIASTGTTAVNTDDYFDTGITHGLNRGLEGISYNPASGVLYVAREKTSPSLFEVTLRASHSTIVNQICTNLDFSTIATDFSEVEYHNGVLYVLTDENNRLIPLDITSTSTCKYVDSDGDNGGVSSTVIDTDDFLNALIAGSPRQPEGVTWDATGDYLYVLAEADFLKKYRTTTFTTR